jgi:hypothetical protein
MTALESFYCSLWAYALWAFIEGEARMWLWPDISRAGMVFTAFVMVVILMAQKRSEASDEA